MTSVLDEVLEQIAAAPHSAAALTLYALVSTLEFEQAGYLFKLVKLRDLSPSQREIAYRLMELMADGNNAGPAWDTAKHKMDAIVRAG
ncbi:MAG: hypothetical protein KDJ24_12360 [Gammaproteobacteria bacterium]|nr:hypothetical protein [Gammaproteobacteria bacterium]